MIGSRLPDHFQQVRHGDDTSDGLRRPLGHAAVQRLFYRAFQYHVAFVDEHRDLVSLLSYNAGTDRSAASTAFRISSSFVEGRTTMISFF